jgi:putative ABC transport system permease protein
MYWSDYLKDALRNLWAHKLRTALTMFGIGWGIFAIILMNAAGEGLRVGQEKQNENFGRDIMIVFAGNVSMQVGATRAGRRVHWMQDDWRVVSQEAFSCRYVIPEEGRNLTVHSRFNSGSILVTASHPPFAEVRSIRVASGRFYNWDDVATARRVAFIGSDTQKQLFGTQEVLGEQVLIQDVPYTIVGTMTPRGQNSSYDGQDVSKIYIPFTAMMNDFPPKPPADPRWIDRMLVVPRSIEDHEPCKVQTRRTLARLHNFKPEDKEAAGIWDTVEDAIAFRQVTDGMKLFLGGVAVVTLFLGGIGVMNVMLVAVRERTREIGVRKAIGATSHAILLQFFIETLLVVLLSGLSGLGLALGFCAGVNRLITPGFFGGMIVDWHAGLFAFAMLALVAVGSAMYPASRAASIDPIEALRYEAGG